MSYVLEKAHFNLGFGFKYQALLALLLNTLFQERAKVFKSEGIPKSYRDKVKKYSKVKNDANYDKFFDNVEKMYKLNNFNLLSVRKNKLKLMLEGEHHHFEDINLFVNYKGKSTTVFYQVKGNDQYYANGKQNICSVKITVDKAIKNFIKNVNINALDDIHMFVLTNRDIQDHFFLKTEEDKEEIINMVLRSQKELIPKKNKHDRLQNTLIKMFTKKIINNTNNTHNLSWNIFDQNKLDEYINFENIKSKYTQAYIVSTQQTFMDTLTTIRNIMKNITIIPYLDYRLVLEYLQYLKKETFEKELFHIEMLSMDAEEIEIKELEKHLLSIGCNNKYVRSISFTKKNKVKTGKMLG